MGKRIFWLAAVKKAITPSKGNKDKNKSKRRGCFGRQTSVNLDTSSLEKVEVMQANPPPTEEVKLLEAESEQNRHAYSVALVTAMAAEAAVAAANAAANVVRLRAAVYAPGKTKEEVASIKIQAAFRGYMARRLLRALRGLVRLKSVMGGESVKRQAAASLKCMQMMARLQSEIRARRNSLLEENSSIQRLILVKNENEAKKFRPFIGEDWDKSTQSKEQIEAKIHSKQEAAMRRERALAYAYKHQQAHRNTSGSTNVTNQTFVDPNTRGWGWSWLERWMAARPWEKIETVEDVTCNDLIAGKTASDSSVPSPTARGGCLQGQPPSRQSPSTPKSRAGGRSRPPSPRGALGEMMT